MQCFTLTVSELHVVCICKGMLLMLHLRCVMELSQPPLIDSPNPHLFNGPTLVAIYNWISDECNCIFFMGKICCNSFQILLL